MEITFNNPKFLWLLISIPLLILTHFISLKFVRQRALVFANFPVIEKVTGKKILSTNVGLLGLRSVILALIILGVSGSVFWFETLSSDANYIIAIDASSSMLADDYSPSRIAVAKSAAIQFIDETSRNAKIGVLSFAGTTFVEQILTEDKSALINAIFNINAKDVGGTDIGEAITTATTMLLGEPDDKAKVVVLLTDGRSNVGQILEEAITYANDGQTTVHTIGIGTLEGGQIAGTFLTSTLDEASLKRISDLTGGNYYRAENEDALLDAYSGIAVASIKKVPIKLTLPFLIAALILIFIEWTLINTRFRTLP